MNFRLAFALTSLVYAQGTFANPPANWEFKEWNAAVAQASAEKKPLFIMFGYEDCTWCEHLYRRAMSDSDVRARYQKSVALTYFDTKGHRPDEVFALPGGAKATHEELIKRFAAYPTPSWVFLSPSGQLLHAGRNGKTTTREMVKDVETALSKL